MTALAQCSFAVWATYVDDPFCPPFVDADRRGGNQDGGGLSARAWFAVAFILAAVLWQLVRAVVKG
jgi:hypothetical protein